MKKVSLFRLIASLIVQFFISAIPVLISGDSGWVQGRIFAAWFTLFCWSVTVALYVRDPGLLAERFRRPGTGGEKKWDVFVTIGIEILFFAWFVIMPLDAVRFRLSPDFPVVWDVAGVLLLLLSSFFITEAYFTNPFLSPIVRIQEERKQRVITTGVYSIVRHPMYLGAVCLYLGAPLLLESVYGLIVGAVSIFVLCFRIVGEEKMLRTGLEGYDDYRKKTKYRLIPFIW